MKTFVTITISVFFATVAVRAQTLADYQATVNSQNPNYCFTFDGGSLISGGAHAPVTLAAEAGGSVVSGSTYPQIAPDMFGNPTNAVYFSLSSDTLVDQNEPSDLIINSGAGGVASTNSTATGSISFLFRSLDPGIYTAQKYILSSGYTGSAHNMMSLYFENTNMANGDPQSLKLRFGNQTLTILQASDVVPDMWYYFAFTYTEATNGYYFDSTGTNLVVNKGKWYLGIPGNTLASGLTTNAIDAVAGNGTFYLGNRDTQTEAFRSPGNGVIDEFATWTRRLSDAEVQAQFTNLPEIAVVTPTSLAAYQNVVVTNQSATYFFPLNGNYVDVVSGTLTLQTNTITDSGSYSFAPDWFNDPTGSAVFSDAHAALTNSFNLLSGGGTVGNPGTGTGQGSISCLFRTPSSTNFVNYADVYMTPGATTTSNGLYLRFDKTTAALNMQFGSHTETILQQSNVVGGVWYYFAMNYDESLTANQVNWWLGEPGGTLNSGTFSASAGSLAGAGTSFVIGNSITLGSAFRQSSSSPGYIADFAIWQNHILTGVEVTNQFDALVVSPAAAPILSIAVSGSHIILSWPSSTDSGYVLQTNANLTTANWASEGATPVTIGNQYVVTNAIGSGATFYRLVK